MTNVSNSNESAKPVCLGVKTTYIYALIDPRTEQIRYIGKTVNPKGRYCSHISPSSRCRKTKDWVQSLIKRGLKPIMEIIDEITDECWQDAEIGYIRLLKACGANLKNISQGGDPGFSGHEETKKLLSASRNPLPVYQFDLQGNLLASYKCSREAEKATGFHKICINRACKADLSAPKQTKLLGGFIFRREPFINEPLVSRRHAAYDVYNKHGKFLFSCTTRKEATEKTGVKGERISDIIKGARKSSNGYVFKRPQKETVLLSFLK